MPASFDRTCSNNVERHRRRESNLGPTSCASAGSTCGAGQRTCRVASPPGAGKPVSVGGAGWYKAAVEKTLEFADLLRLLHERSTALQAAVAAAPSLDVQVPTCPEWTLLDLVQHLVEKRHKWAATVAAGPA